MRANQELARQLARQGGDADVRITFRTYLSPDQFITWATQEKLQIKHVQLGVLYEPDPPSLTPVPCPTCPGSDLVTRLSWLGVEAQPGDPALWLKTRIAEAVAQRNQKVRSNRYRVQKVQGICFISTTVPAQQLPALANDPQVFLAEVTGEFLRRQVRAAGITEQVRIEYDPASASWSNNSFPQIEKLGPDNLTK